MATQHKAHPPRTAAIPTPQPRQVAVLDIGARAIRLDIAEITGTRMNVLESLQRSVSLGKETFGAGSINRASIEECVDIIRGFRQIMEEYGITSPDQIRAVATSSVREAANRDAFLDRIYIATGIPVTILEDAEVEHLIHLATHDLFETSPALLKGSVIIIEVGGGTTRLLLVQDGFVTHSRTYKLGALRIQESLDTYQTPPDRLCAVLDQHIQRTVNQMAESIPVTKKPVLIALAGDMENAAHRLVGGWNSSDTTLIRMPRFTLAETIVATSPEDLMRDHHLPPHEAETAGQTLLIYDRIARAFGVNNMILTVKSMRRGLLMKMAGQSVGTARFAEQLAHSATALGRKYRFDETHAAQVADISLKLFRALQPEHGLGAHHEALLRTAAILHDIGTFVSNTSHHKHSMYLILNSELFGLTQRDNTIVALVARYHRRSVPRPTHPEYATLDRESRITTSKLASILRIADALDRSHIQHTHDITFSREDKRFVITIANVEDVTLERLALREKGSLFESIFGMQVVLRTASTVKGPAFDG